jgi:PPK2 family polyphosphate:nucleotide phosphotransferase
MERCERMKLFMDLTKVTPDKKFCLKNLETGWAQAEEAKFIGKDALKEKANKLLEENRVEMAKAQELLYASHTWSILVILQGMDASGKDGVIKHVLSGVNPQGCRVTSFKQPSDMELDHDFMWRQVTSLPAKGMLGIFNRSYYEEVLVVKVHQALLEKQNLPLQKFDKKFWENRYQDISSYERYLSRNGTLILKFFLNISKDEQKKRLLERLNNPDKHWKFSESDIEERKYWDQYIQACEDMLTHTSTKWAPWFVIPADYKWVARTLIADIITTSIHQLDLKYPKGSPQKQAAIEDAKKRLT